MVAELAGPSLMAGAKTGKTKPSIFFLSNTIKLDLTLKDSNKA